MRRVPPNHGVDGERNEELSATNMVNAAGRDFCHVRAADQTGRRGLISHGTKKRHLE